VSFTQRPGAHGKPAWVPNRLPRLDAERALAVVELPLHLNWSAPGRVFDLGSRADRARVYEIVLQEGRPADILAYVDGALLAASRFSSCHGRYQRVSPWVDAWQWSRT
jgi:hypothetical protein